MEDTTTTRANVIYVLKSDETDFPTWLLRFCSAVFTNINYDAVELIDRLAPDAAEDARFTAANS